MDKEEAIKILKDFHDESAPFSIRTALETLYPEFKESRDEKVRKRLIEFFKDWGKTRSHCWSIYIPDILAWLEKQGECHISHDDEIMIKQLTEYFTTGHGLQNTNETVVEWLNDVKEKLEKQGEQKPQRMISAEAKEAMYDKPADKVEPKFKVKYAGSEYNVLEIKEIAGVTYYGIEDEPNHIDYVLPDNCEIVSEQKPTWSEEDEKMVDNILTPLAARYPFDIYQPMYNWLKALKQRIGG